MPNEFVIKHGFHSKDDSQVTGSLDVSGTLTAGGSVVAGGPFTQVGSTTTYQTADDTNLLVTGSLIVSGSLQAFKMDTTNVILGLEAGEATGTNQGNVLLGYRVAGGGLGSTAYNVIALGREAAYNVGSNDNIIALGFKAARNANCANGVWIGYEAGMQWGGTGNTMVGYQAGRGDSGAGNIATYNTFIGNQAGYIIADGDNNTALGQKSLYSLSDGSSNIAIGNQAGANIVDGNRNIVIGLSASLAGDYSDQLFIGSASLATISGSLVTGETIVRSQRPFQTIGTNPFTASADNVGNYFRMGGNVTCSIKVNATASCPVGAEFDFFQTSSALNVLFEADPGVTINSKNDNLNLSGQFSSATIKKVGTDEWDLMGDLT